MDWEIRIAILVVGLALIGYIVYDFKRRRKNESEKQKLIDTMHDSANQKDSSGFDFTGVGEARRAGIEPTFGEETEAQESDANEEGSRSGDIPSDDNSALSSDDNKTLDATTESKPSSQKSPPQSLPSGPSQRQAPTEQMSLETDSENQAEQPVEPEQVISMILRAKEGMVFRGGDFMPLLLSQGLRHGEMGIFHRHQNSNGKPGPVLYSVANAVNPGTFDIQNIELFETPAFAFFMTLPCASDPMATYEGMVKTIRMLSDELDGQILDESRSVFTEQSYQYQIDQLREYMTKQSLKP